MAVAFDAFSEVAAGTGPLSWTHTPVGTPRAIVVWVIQDASATSEITGVTYGGTAMTEVPLSPSTLTGGENSAVHAFHLGASIPTGAQTVSVTQSGAVRTKKAGAVSLTAAADTEVVDTSVISNISLANPSVTVSLAGRSCFVGIGFHSGQNAPTGITELASWTARTEHDFGTKTCGIYTYDTIDTPDVSAGWTQTAEDANAVAVAISEVASTDRRGVVTWAEFEVPNEPRRGIVTWAEIEIPNEPRRGVVTWAEFEVPDLSTDRRAVITWAELEVPSEPRRGVVTWAEMEVPPEPRRAVITWAELETPDAPRRAIITWAEFETPDAPVTDRRGIITWAELEVPNEPRRAVVTWAELEVPEFGEVVEPDAVGGRRPRKRTRRAEVVERAWREYEEARARAEKRAKFAERAVARAAADPDPEQIELAESATSAAKAAIADVARAAEHVKVATEQRDARRVEIARVAQNAAREMRELGETVRKLRIEYEETVFLLTILLLEDE